MRIATYNIFEFMCLPSRNAAASLGDKTDPRRIEYFAGVFEKLDCDVLAIQEGTAPAKTMQEIARRLKTYLATIASPGNWPGQVLSRYPIVESRAFSHFDPVEPVPVLSRCAGAARVQVSPSRQVWIVNLHLHPSDREMRTRECQVLASHIQSLEQQCPDVVVLGDFNSTVEEELHVWLDRRGYVNAVREATGTLSFTMDTEGAKQQAIDHIYLSPSLAGALQKAYVVREAGFRHDGPYGESLWVPSDHLPVVAELAI